MERILYLDANASSSTSTLLSQFIRTTLLNEFVNYSVHYSVSFDRLKAVGGTQVKFDASDLIASKESDKHSEVGTFRVL